MLQNVIYILGAILIAGSQLVSTIYIGRFIVGIGTALSGAIFVIITYTLNLRSFGCRDSRCSLSNRNISTPLQRTAFLCL